MSRPRLASRHRSREVALQVLYALDVAESRSDEAPAAQEVFEGAAAQFEIPPGAVAFAKELVCETTRYRSAIDAELASHARRWRVSRMAAVDRNVLRLATYELLHTDTPTPVVLDEAVELARRFGAGESPAFVNGILDSIAKAHRTESS
ncbi:MAG: transcription antitermination factor NusB [Proteobacteria bacterium]|nr:transcription antitermination factor NusB [Pseudomonadota bacterium]